MYQQWYSVGLCEPVVKLLGDALLQRRRETQVIHVYVGKRILNTFIGFIFLIIVIDIMYMVVSPDCVPYRCR